MITNLVRFERIGKLFHKVEDRVSTETAFLFNLVQTDFNANMGTMFLYGGVPRCLPVALFYGTQIQLRHMAASCNVKK